MHLKNSEQNSSFSFPARNPMMRVIKVKTPKAKAKKGAAASTNEVKAAKKQRNAAEKKAAAAKKRN